MEVIALPIWCQNRYFPPLDLIHFDYPIIPKSFHSVSAPIKLITMLTHNAIFFTPVSWFCFIKACPATQQNYSRMWYYHMEKQNKPLFKIKQAQKTIRKVWGFLPSTGKWWHGHFTADLNFKIIGWRNIEEGMEELKNWLIIEKYGSFLKRILTKYDEVTCLAKLCDPGQVTPSSWVFVSYQETRKLDDFSDPFHF